MTFLLRAHRGHVVQGTEFSSKRNTQTHTNTNTHTHAHRDTHTQTQTHTNTHTDTHTHSHTHTYLVWSDAFVSRRRVEGHEEASATTLTLSSLTV